MQAKEIDARLEIVEGKVVPLRMNLSAFAYRDDVDLLQRYYDELWRAYLFVAPHVFSDARRVRAVLNAMCAEYDIPLDVLLRKVRGHQEFESRPEHEAPGRVVVDLTETISSFLDEVPLDGAPLSVPADVLRRAARDPVLQASFETGEDLRRRLSGLFEAAALEAVAADEKVGGVSDDSQKRRLRRYAERIRAGDDVPTSVRSWRPQQSLGLTQTFSEYAKQLVEQVLLAPADGPDVEPGV
jgi:hypothetical protein